MNDMSNRPRSQAVRSAAQAHLAALREERLARRRARSRQVPEPEPEPDPVPMSDLDADEMVRVDPATPQVEDAETDDAVDDIAAFVPVEDAPDAQVTEDAEVPVDMSPEEADDARAIEDTAAEPAQDAPTEVETDLDRLPGIGPGLIWMLQSAGIASLSDMATADPEALAVKLGLVGQLLDLEFWISQAAELRAGAV